MKLFRSPPRYETTPTNVRLAPPRLGAHTEEVLREAGIENRTTMSRTDPSSAGH
jgi:crotonobetainyl-CoA:carnitine CoA-transferase CaiB-like acyl-CoA transferase